MSTDIPPGIVERAKNKIQTLFDKMRVSNDEFYILIKSCFDLFWDRYSEDMGWIGTRMACVPKPMEHPDAINIIRKQVMPWLRRAQACIDDNSQYFLEFQAMHIFFKKWFDNDTQQPSNKVLNSEKSENEPPSNKVLSSEKSENEPPSNNEKSQHERPYDMNSINILISTLQKQMNAVPSILLRLDNLEAKVTSLHQQTSQPPQNTPKEDAQQETPAKSPANTVTDRRRLGTFSTKDPFSNSYPEYPKSDMHQQASIDTLLQKISLLENDFKCL
jgi:hypothetical protein